MTRWDNVPPPAGGWALVPAATEPERPDVTSAPSPAPEPPAEPVSTPAAVPAPTPEPEPEIVADGLAAVAAGLNSTTDRVYIDRRHRAA